MPATSRNKTDESVTPTSSKELEIVKSLILHVVLIIKKGSDFDSPTFFYWVLIHIKMGHHSVGTISFQEHASVASQVKFFAGVKIKGAAAGANVLDRLPIRVVLNSETSHPICGGDMDESTDFFKSTTATTSAVIGHNGIEIRIRDNLDGADLVLGATAGARASTAGVGCAKGDEEEGGRKLHICCNTSVVVAC